MKISINDFKIVKHDAVKGNFTVVIDDAIELHGFRLMYSKNKDSYYVASPTNKYNDKYYDLVVFSNPIRKRVLSDAIDCYNLENKSNIVFVD